MSAACTACGQMLPLPTGPVYAFEIARKVPTMNDHIQNQGSARWRYKRDREAWALEFRAVRMNGLCPRAMTKRRVTFVRLYTGREREWDNGNFVGGLKLVLDAMVKEALLIDDNSKFLDDVYRQEKCDRTGLRVEIVEL